MVLSLNVIVKTTELLQSCLQKLTKNFRILHVEEKDVKVGTSDIRWWKRESQSAESASVTEKI